jgi:U3 small nucleolar RNA-associated protein 14
VTFYRFRYPFDTYYEGSQQKLNLDDLLNPLSNSLLKKATKALKGSGPNAGALQAPLPLRTQDRLDREAAYEQTKEEVDKWKSSMKQLKEVIRDG